MKVRNHLLASTLLSGGVYAATQSPQAAASCFLSGTLIDIDHLFDFLAFSDEKLTFNNLFSWCNEERWKKIYLVFHSYEFYLILGIFTYYFPGNILIGVLLGSGLHLLMDQAGSSSKKKSNKSIWFYFFTFRLFVGFRKEKLLRNYVVS